MTQDATPQTDPARAAAVFFDGGCPVCRAEISAYRRMQGAGSVDWRDVNTAELPPGLDRELALARFHVARADGALVSGFRAFMAVWRVHPRLRLAAMVLDYPPFAWIGEAAYRVFLAVRPLWRRRR